MKVKSANIGKQMAAEGAQALAAEKTEQRAQEAKEQAEEQEAELSEEERAEEAAERAAEQKLIFKEMRKTLSKLAVARETLGGLMEEARELGGGSIEWPEELLWALECEQQESEEFWNQEI